MIPGSIKKIVDGSGTPLLVPTIVIVHVRRTFQAIAKLLRMRGGNEGPTAAVPFEGYCFPDLKSLLCRLFAAKSPRATDICRAVSTTIGDIARIDRSALLRPNHLGIEAETPSAHLSMDNLGKKDQEDRDDEPGPTKTVRSE